MFFFDESRFGTHSKIGRGWFKKGLRSSVKIKLGFQNFYVYTAVEPSSGQEFSLILPYVNTICMNIFLSEFAKELGEQEAIVIMDGAGWHKSDDLVVPGKIEIFHLPPYSPELNPVERLWLYIKKDILCNKIYDDLATLESAVCDFINNLNCHIIAQICRTSYMIN